MPENLYVWPDLLRPIPPRKKIPGTNRVTVGRKFCSCCGRWRHAVDFNAYSWSARGVVLQLQSRCATCSRTMHRLKKGGTIKPRKYGKANHEEKLAQNRASYNRRRKDPEYLERFREGQRIYLEAKRREAGIKPRNFSDPARRGDRSTEMVENAPIREAFLRQQESGQLTATELAKRIGWLDGNGGDYSRMMRRLGLVEDVTVKKGKRYARMARRMNYADAVRIVRALGLDPVDFDL